MKPRLKPFINIVRDGEQTCYLIASEKDLFRCQGQSVPALVDKVLPLLDGTRTVTELGVALAGVLSERALQGMLELLQRNHVVTDADTEIGSSVPFSSLEAPAFPGLMTLLSRYSDRPDQLLGNLRRARVVVVGESAWAPEMVEVLRDCAVGAIDVVMDGQLTATSGPVPVRHWDLSHLAEVVPGADLIIGLQDGEFCFLERLHELNHLCLKLRASWLHVRLTLEAEGWIGPFYVPDGSCFACLNRRLRSNLKNARENTLHEQRIAQGLLTGKRLDFAPFRRMLAAQAAIETVLYLTGIETTQLIGRCRLVDLLTGNTSLHTVLRYPHCPACGKQRTGRVTPWGSDELMIERMLLPRGVS